MWKFVIKVVMVMFKILHDILVKILICILDLTAKFSLFIQKRLGYLLVDINVYIYKRVDGREAVVQTSSEKLEKFAKKLELALQFFFDTVCVVSLWAQHKLINIMDEFRIIRKIANILRRFSNFTLKPRAILHDLIEIHKSIRKFKVKLHNFFKKK